MDNKIDFDGRDLVSYLLDEDEVSDDAYFTDWFEFVKNARKVQAEKRFFFLKNANIIGQNYNILKIFKTKLIAFCHYLIKFKGFKKKINKDSIRLFNNLSYYFNLNYYKIKKLKEKNYYYNSENLIIILDIRISNPKIHVISKNKSLFSVTSGLVLKKLNLIKKKIKKTEKMLNLMLKTTFLRLQKILFFRNCIVHIKGTKSNLQNILVMINKIFKKKNVSLIYAPHISYGRFKFKKIKSIKKRLRKKFTKLIKK